MQHDPEVMQYCVTHWLNDIGKKDTNIRTLEAAIADVRSRLDGLNFAIGTTRVLSSGNSDKLANGIAKLMDAEQRWADAVAADFDDIEEARDICIGDHIGYRACFDHYAMHVSWNMLGRTYGYTSRHVRRKAAEAIGGIYDRMPEDARRVYIPNAIPSTISDPGVVADEK